MAASYLLALHSYSWAHYFNAYIPNKGYDESTSTNLFHCPADKENVKSYGYLVSYAPNVTLFPHNPSGNVANKYGKILKPSEFIQIMDFYLGFNRFSPVGLSGKAAWNKGFGDQSGQEQLPPELMQRHNRQLNTLRGDGSAGNVQVPTPPTWKNHQRWFAYGAKDAAGNWLY